MNYICGSCEKEQPGGVEDLTGSIWLCYNSGYAESCQDSTVVYKCKKCGEEKRL